MYVLYLTLLYTVVLMASFLQLSAFIKYIVYEFNKRSLPVSASGVGCMLTTLSQVGLRSNSQNARLQRHGYTSSH